MGLIEIIIKNLLTLKADRQPNKRSATQIQH